MISSKNRVQAIKNKFENLNTESEPILRKKSSDQLYKHTIPSEYERPSSENDKEYRGNYEFTKKNETESESDDSLPKPNNSYLYSKTDIKRSLSDPKKSLTRQSSDPSKKLHRSHAFRCDRNQKLQSPKRHGSCNGRAETSDFSLKMGERKLSRDRLKRLGCLLEDQMKKENFVFQNDDKIVVGEVQMVQPVQTPDSIPDSIPDSEVPQHILDQYAKVNKPKKQEDVDTKQDAMTDSGVSSETENLDEDKNGRIKRLMSQFEKTDSQESDKVNLEVMNDLCASSETIKLERKNPHLILTDTLKKALKQPLPAGPPPKKPPRIFVSPIPETSEKQKKDAKKMLEKLEQVLQKREAQNQKNIYDIAETDLSVKKPKEIHYLCTEILGITQRTLLPNQNTNDPLKNCFNSLNCAILTNSTSSLPYTRLNSEPNSNRNSVKICCSCSNDSLNRNITKSDDSKCTKCQINKEKHDRFKCHLSCNCKLENSQFYVEKEHIYDEPYIGDSEVTSSKDNEVKNRYGTLNISKKESKSLEDLSSARIYEDQKIYDIPCDVSRPETPESTTSKIDFEKLRQNFETGFRDTDTKKKSDDTKKSEDTKKSDDKKSDDTKSSESKTSDDTKKIEKPMPLKPKPILVNTKLKSSVSTENISEGKFIKRSVENKFATETKRYRREGSSIGFSLPKKDHSQLDVDKENLNRLMSEIYETVTAACNMDENKPASFPTDQSDGSTSEDSVKLTRSLTEKRKNYVRRVSSRVAYLEPKSIRTRFRHQTSVCSYKAVYDNPYSTFRSWKSFRASQNNLKDMDIDSNDSKVNLTDSKGNILSLKDDFSDASSIDEKAGCVVGLPFERDRGLFNVCLLVGLNYMSGEAYVKSVFPSQVHVPPHIENLIFPETLSSASKGEWTADANTAQCYSLVLTDERGERSYGYCRRVLPEGATTCLPLCYCLIGRYRAPGFYYKVLQEIESHHGSSDVEIHSILQQVYELDFPNPGEEIHISYTKKLIHSTRNSLDVDEKCKTMPDMRRSNEYSIKNDSDKCASTEVKIADYYDLENNNEVLSFEAPRTKLIKRPIEPRVDEDSLSVMLDRFGAGLSIKVFASLLLERKVIIISDDLSCVSRCMEALQTTLYPFVWQQPLISTIPSAIHRDVLEAPLPILAGMLKTNAEEDISSIMFEEGMLIDLTQPSKVLFYQGDETTILPTSCYKTLKTSLQMESSKHKEKQEDIKTRNVMISEAFLRFFVDILGDFWKYFSSGEVKDGDFGKNGVVFDKDTFIKNATSKQNQYFLEWFTETAMFNHFIQNMALYHQNNKTENLIDTPLPNYYELFHERVSCRNKINKNNETKNYKSAVNKKVKLLKTKLRDLVA